MLITAALESAVKEENWSEIDLLLEERSDLVDALVDSSDEIPAEQLRQLKKADDRLLHTMTKLHAQIGDELRRGYQTALARVMYREAAVTSTYDIAS